MTDTVPSVGSWVYLLCSFSQPTVIPWTDSEANGIPAVSSKMALTYEVLMQGFHKWLHFPSWDKVFARCSDTKRTQLFAKAGQTQNLQSLGASPVPSTCTIWSPDQVPVEYPSQRRLLSITESPGWGLSLRSSSFWLPIRPHQTQQPALAFPGKP